MQELHIGENDAGQRFDKYLKKLLAEAPGSFVYKMLRKKNITLNGKKADGEALLRGRGEVVSLGRDLREVPGKVKNGDARSFQWFRKDFKAA